MRRCPRCSSDGRINTDYNVNFKYVFFCNTCGINYCSSCGKNGTGSNSAFATCPNYPNSNCNGHGQTIEMLDPYDQNGPI